MKLPEDKVPATVVEAIQILSDGVEPGEIDFILHNDPQQVTSMVHFTFGMHLRNQWSLWEDTPLRREFIGMGISHPDDISSIINTSFCRHVRGEDIRIEEQIKRCQDHWMRHIGKPMP